MVRDLEAIPPERPVELAFYGGTFTALPLAWIERFLEAAQRFRQAGAVSAVRCSTRPDACSPALLARLAAMGLDTVELGVQSFHDAALLKARRGHTGRDVLEACAAVRGAGLGLGIQLLPGLPGHTPGMFEQDIALCVQAAPDLARLHPCLVLPGTILAEMWRRGEYAPWPLDAAVTALAKGVLSLWRAGIAVTRIGLAPEPSFDEAVLAGPRHPALGTMVRGRALYEDIRERLGGRRAASLAAPQSLSGEFWGHGRELAGAYAALGLDTQAVRFEDRDDFLLDVIHDE
jgi:histone acetyltransferase (RNA polymerase elongator complex component)